LLILLFERETAEYQKRQRIKSKEFREASVKEVSSKIEINKNDDNLNELEFEYDPIRSGGDRNPFILQDRLLSKWSCSLQISKDGVLWKECEHVRYCENCGDKVIFKIFL
jgi:hypothetical protein